MPRTRLFLTLLLLGVCAPVGAQSAKAPPFLVGGDVSYLAREEQLGAAYKDHGRPGDALAILKSHGWNCLRLRLWVHPDEQSPGRWDTLNDLPYTLTLARRIKQAGFKLLLDLHYSDTWADPGHQTKPAAWTDLTFDQLTQQVETYSRDTIAAFRKDGAMPDIVAVGNEITNGMLWPDGQVEKSNGWTNLGALLKAGIQGVKEGAAPQRPPRIMIHIASGASTGLVRWFFDSLDAQKQGIAFDVIGFSYYPDGKETLVDLKKSLAFTANKYHKPIIIAETGYPYAGTPKPDQSVYTHYGLTPDGQQRYLTDLVAAVKETPGGLGHGVIYWEPEWVSISGLAQYYDHCPLFDNNFNALPAIGALGGQ